jgi:uncharacterized alkaline shock family protein YloU
VTSSGDPSAEHTDEVDIIAAAALACPAVAGLRAGGPVAVATYLPGRRVDGVRVGEDRVLVSVVLAYGSSVSSLEKQVRTALAPHVAGRSVDVHVADVESNDEAARGG